MDDFEKDHHYSDVAEISTVPIQPHEAQQDMPEITTRRLRDRTLLKRKREEALEKDYFQGQTSSKGQRKGKTTGRGRRNVQKTEPDPDVQIELAPEAEPQTAPEFLQEKTEVGFEHLHYHEDPSLTVTKESNNNATFLTHEDHVHVSHSRIPFLTEDKEPDPEEEASPVSLATIPLPETLSFSQGHQHEEQNMYTHLL